MKPVVIIGGGISGLTAAYYLKRRGIEAVVVEPDPVLGGLLRTDRVEGCTVETGADSWLASKPWARELAADLGIGGDVLGSNDAMRSIKVLRRGKFVPFPKGMQLIVPKTLRTVWTAPLFDIKTKIRMTADRFRRPAPPIPERSVAQFTRDHFGQGAVDYLAEPLLTGIYGGSVDYLSAGSVLPKLVERERQHGSITRTAGNEPPPKGSTFQSMRGGLAQLCEALRPERVVRASASALRRADSGWQVRANTDWIDASQVILAVPANAAVQLTEGRLSELLSGIRHSSGHIVAMAFRNAAPLEGFGALIPRMEGHNLMAATWVSTKFPSRAPEGVQLIRAFFREHSHKPLQEFSNIFGSCPDPLFVREYEWPESLPQYAVGHSALIKEIRSQAPSGLHLIGNAYDGVGIPDCIRLAKAAANLLVV